MFCNDFSNKKRLIPVTHLPPLLFRVDAAAAVRIYPVESSGMAFSPSSVTTIEVPKIENARTSKSMAPPP